MKNYTVFFKKANYNPYKSYGQNFNRRAGSKSFETETEARAFAETVDNGRVYYLGVRI